MPLKDYRCTGCRATVGACRKCGLNFLSVAMCVLILSSGQAYAEKKKEKPNCGEGLHAH